MSLSQKVVLGGAVVVFVLGIGWMLQYVSDNNVHLGKGDRMMNVTTDEKGTVLQSSNRKEESRLVSDQKEAPALAQPLPPTATATIESKSQAEQALLEIESSFGEIEADMSANE